MTATPTDSPVDRLLKRGADALTDTELVAILLRNKGTRIPPLEQARTFLALFGGNIPGLLACNSAIARAQKLGPGPAATLLAAIELGRRLPRAPQPAELLVNSQEALSYLILQIRARDQEVLGAVFVDPNQRIAGLVECLRGTESSMAMDTKTIFREAICRKAQGIYLFHFKPGGAPPSADDGTEPFIQEVLAACEALGFILLDYLLLSGGGSLSMREKFSW